MGIEKNHRYQCYRLLLWGNRRGLQLRCRDFGRRQYRFGCSLRTHRWADIVRGCHQLGMQDL